MNMNWNNGLHKMSCDLADVNTCKVVLPDWKERLPVDYAGQVTTPVEFEYFEEPTAHAYKLIGNDEHGQCCYYRHRYSLMREVLDDDDNFYQEEAYWEEVRAWRLHGGEWLRCSIAAGNAGVCRDRRLEVQYTVTPTRPR